MKRNDKCLHLHDARVHLCLGKLVRRCFCTSDTIEVYRLNSTEKINELGKKIQQQSFSKRAKVKTL